MMHSKIIGLCLCLASVAVAQNYYEEFESGPSQQPQHRPAPARLQPGSGPVADTKPAPVAILKQINRHNEDGSYTYGFEGADGSFKIETKAQTGEVKGKYGYVDETGKVRVVEYGADKYGFQPVGEGITVAPPTLIDESRNRDIQEYDEEEQRPAQRPYIARIPSNSPRARPAPQRVQQPQQYEEYQPQPQQQPQYEYRAQAAPQEPRRQQFHQSSQGPVPPRSLAIPGAAPTSDVTYSPTQRPPRPEPQQFNQPRANFAPQQYEPHQLSRGYEVEQQSAAPVSAQHQQLQFSAPQPRPQQTHTVARPKALPPQGRTSVLDQLAKDYALPANGSPALTDISFGFY